MPDLDPEGSTASLGQAIAKILTGHLGGTGWQRGVTNFEYDPVEGALTITLSNGSTVSVDTSEDLRGADGADGTDGTNGTNGSDGIDGEDGASAFEIAQANGFTGTEAQWAALTNPPVVEITASRALAAADLYRRLRGNSASAIALTVPADATADLALSRYPIENVGAGILTVSVEVGATLNGVDGGSVSLARYQAAAIEKIGANTWIVPNAEVI